MSQGDFWWVKFEEASAPEWLTQKFDKTHLEEVVEAKQGFPETRMFNFSRIGNSTTLSVVTKGGWAEEHTNLQEFIGWDFVKINSEDVATIEEFNRVKAALNPGDPVTFTMRKYLRDKYTFPVHAKNIFTVDGEHTKPWTPMKRQGLAINGKSTAQKKHN